MANREEHANGSMQVYNSSDAAYSSRRRTSPVWNHFRKLTVDGELKAECNYCHDLLVAQSTKGTSHLNRHIKSCPKRPGANQEQYRDLSLESDLSVLMKQKNIEQDISPEEIARMMISHEQSFSILEQNNYWQFLTHLNPMLKTISHITIEEKLLAIFEEEKLKLLEIFSRSCSRVSLSANMVYFNCKRVLCLKAHFIDEDWKIHRKTIKLDLMAAIYEFTNNIYETIEDWNFDKKLLAMTTDQDEIDISALEMDLAESNSSPTKGKLWVLPCTVEQINGLFCKIYPISDSFSRFFFGQDFLKFVSQLEIKHPHFANRELRENYFILKSCLFFMEKFPDRRFTSPWGDILPSDEELKVAKRFCNLVLIVDDAMKVFSGHDNSTSNLYFHSFCKVRKALEEASYDADYKEIFKTMKSHLDEYFQRSYVWLSIPVILDPRFKIGFIIRYFQEVFGADAPEYNSEIKKKFTELFVDCSFNVGKQNRRTSYCKSFGLETGFESNDALHNSQVMIISEFDRYLQDKHIIPREGEFDILKWWRDHSGEGQYPILACMAKGILAIPASSAVLFDDNHNRGVVSLLMTNLRKKTIDAIVCTQDWLKLTVGEHEQLERSTKYADDRIEVCKKLTSVTVDGNVLVSKAQIQKLCKMIASHGVAFMVLGHDDSWEFFTRLNPIFNMISRVTMAQNFLAVFEEEKIKLKELFNRSCGRVFLSAKIFDFVEYGALAGESILSLRAHFIDQEWQIHRKIVKYCLCKPYRGPHRDVELCHVIYHNFTHNDRVEFVDNIMRETITDWSFGEKLMGLTTDKDCWNLKWRWLTSIISVNRHLTEIPISSCAAELINGIINNYAQNDTFIQEIYQFEYLEDSFWDNQKYLQIISQLDLHHPHAKSLLWYKVYCKLEVGLRLATISPAEKSKAAEKFCKIARTFYDALKVVAVSDNLTSNLYFHAFWSIRTCLQEAKSNTESEELRGIEKMSNSLEKYLQESYLWLSIPVVLDPRYKIRSIEECFEQAFGSDAFKYISQVKRKLHELLISYFDVDEQCNGSSNSDLETPHHCDQYVSTHMEKQVIMELDRYYGDSLILRNGDFEILQWWKDNTWVYPTVACVAQDILAMSLSTVNFEEAFYDDCSRTYSTKDISFKSKLNAKTMEAFECMQDWTKSTEPIPTSSPGDADNDHALASQRKRKETSETQKSKSKAKRAANFPTHHSSSMGQTDMTASTPTPKIVPPLLSSLPLHDWVGASTSSPPLLSSQRNISKLTIADSQSEAKSSQSPSASKPHSTPSPSALPRIPAEDIFVLDFDSLGEGSSFKSILGRLGFLLDNYGADETLQHLGVIKEQVALLSRDHEMPEDLKTVLGDICTLDDEVVEAEKRHQLREKVMEKRKMLEKISGVVLQRFENAQSIKKEHSQMEARVAELTCELEQLKNRLGNVQNALEKAKKEGKEAQAEAKHLLQEITGDEALLDKPKRLLKAARVCIANILDSK